MSANRRQERLHRPQNGTVIIGDSGMGTQHYHDGTSLDAVLEYLNRREKKLGVGGEDLIPPVGKVNLADALIEKIRQKARGLKDQN